MDSRKARAGPLSAEPAIDYAGASAGSLMRAQFHVLDSVSAPSGTINDDRIGQAGPLAWVLDGATDVGSERLLPGGSDAAWFAGRLDQALRELGGRAPPAAPPGLFEILAHVTGEVASAFERERLRSPAARHELPSAAGVLVAAHARGLAYLNVADCELLVAEPGAPAQTVGADPASEAGDRRLAELLRRHRIEAGEQHWKEARRKLWPSLQMARARMNEPGGYGVFSTNLPPAELVRSGEIELAAGSRIMLASDGLMRLVHVFERYRSGELIAAASERGLADLLAELRTIEADDGNCQRFPRTKPSDDASALLLEWRPAPD